MHARAPADDEDGRLTGNGRPHSKGRSYQARGRGFTNKTLWPLVFADTRKPRS
jgi:hypothetical protein